MSRSGASRAAVRLVGYALALTAALGGGYALGTAFPDETPAPVPHADRDGGHDAGHDGVHDSGPATDGAAGG